MEPETIGRFRIVRRLGAGGMGVVYEGIDDMLGRRAAIKVLRDETAANETGRQRFLREARAAAAVSEHDNVGTIYEVGEDGETLYLAMEFIEGRTLRALAHEDPPDLARTLEIMTDIAKALAAAHEAGLVHRDLKPDNVMIEDSGGRAKVLDFGLAKLATRDDAQTIDDAEAETVTPEMAAELTSEGVIVGSPGYMSPEQLYAKPVDARTDVWSFGVVLYELLAGRRPFSNPHQLALVVSICKEDAAPLGRDDLPEALTTLVERCLAKKPEDRPADGAALVGALDELSGSRNAPAPDTSEMATAPTVASDAVMAADTEVVAEAMPVKPRNTAVLIGVVAVSLSIAAFGWMLGARLDGDSTTTTTTERPEVGVPADDPVAEDPAPEDPGGRAPPVHPRLCGDEVDRPCAEGSSAWCLPEGRRVACCGEGLVPEQDGLCGCPPGGASVESAIEHGCDPAPSATERRASIRASIAEQRDVFRDCYQTSLASNERLEGSVVLDFTLSPWGEITEAGLAGATLPDVGAQRCMLEALRSASFAAPGGAEPTSIQYPLHLAR